MFSKRICHMRKCQVLPIVRSFEEKPGVNEIGPT